jgi:hypothetical protein
MGDYERFPLYKIHIACIFLPICTRSLWQKRRVVWTKYVIYLTSVSEYTVFDSIPLAEIASTQQVNEANRSEPLAPSAPSQHRQSSIKSADSSQTRFQHALQLKTIPDGFNSGRTYYLQAASDEQCRAVCESISRLARRAREEAAATSRIRRAQAHVAAVYDSTPFQSAVALLIITVIFLPARRCYQPINALLETLCVCARIRPCRRDPVREAELRGDHRQHAAGARGRQRRRLGRDVGRQDGAGERDSGGSKRRRERR